MTVATKVNACTVTDCAYNANESCHALAITIDNPSPATCATYTPKAEGKRGGAEMTVANIGACKAANCVHNEALTCQAGEVKIGMQDGKVSCLTFKGQ